ncbi:MAG: MSCRAMM family protein, partial [Candidatus Saliniplasma sp.]
GEEMLEGWEFNLWNTTDGEVDSIIDTNTTGANGCAMFWNLEPGLYAIQEVLEENGEWFNTTDLIQFAEVTSDETVEVWFGNAQYSRLYGLKFCDFNLDGYADEDEELLEGWTIYLWSVNEFGDLEEIIDTQITNDGGWYNFGRIMPGKYYVQEELPNGWFNSTPTLVYVDLELGEQIRIDFGNYKLSNITGLKFFDCNQDGMYNESDGDYPIEDWMVNLWSTNETTGLPKEVIQTSYTDEDGYFYFFDLKPGYYWIQEDVPGGWINTTASLVQVKADCYNEVIEVNFGNYREDDSCIGRIYGYKFFDTNQNSIFDGDDWYMDGWGINIWNTTDGEKNEIIRTAYTDVDGYFNFPELEAGLYYVEEVIPGGWTNTTDKGLFVDLDCNDEEEVLFGNWAPIVCGPEGHTRGFWGHNVCRNTAPGDKGYQVPYEDVLMYLENISDRYGDDYEFLDDLDQSKACEILSYVGSDMQKQAEVQILALLLTAEHYDYYESEPMVHIPGIHHDYFVGTMEEAIDIILANYDLGTQDGYEAAKDMADWLNNIDAGDTYNEMFEGCYMLEP